jgi:hypothetical protein
MAVPALSSTTKPVEACGPALPQAAIQTRRKHHRAGHECGVRAHRGEVVAADGIAPGDVALCERVEKNDLPAEIRRG